MNAEHVGLVADEAELMRQRLSLGDARIVELGCGRAELAARLLEHHGVQSIIGFEVDERQHGLNLSGPSVNGLHFALGGAESTGLPDASCDGVMMLKSLHHVPMEAMDEALDEIARILVPGGWLYVSEPVYAGDFNEIVRLFHDEGEVRAAAYDALRRAPDRGLLSPVQEFLFDTALHFKDYSEFVDRIVRTTVSKSGLPPERDNRVRAAFEPFLKEDGARFVRQMRVNILRRNELL